MSYHPKNHYLCHPYLTTRPDGFMQLTAADPNLVGDNPCKFIIHDPETGIFNYDCFPIPPSILTFPNVDNRYAELHAFGIINQNGDINQDAWSSVKNALLRPHHEAVCKQARSDRRKEKELKKCRFKDANPDGFAIPSTAGHGKKKRTRKAKSFTPSPSSSNVPLDNMPVDEYADETDAGERRGSLSITAKKKQNKTKQNNIAHYMLIPCTQSSLSLNQQNYILPSPILNSKPSAASVFALTNSRKHHPLSPLSLMPCA
ncbi:hypothetical protein C0995_014572 [Termitomyces sp. Mi166|nr:hypothetical protein C0995_014572 [Termitomyces sp. Mi166\